MQLKHILGLSCLLLVSLAQALDLSMLTQQEAGTGLKETLNHAAEGAVDLLGKSGGFLDNPNVRIPLPEGLQKAEQVMKLMGKQKEFDELEVSINRAAEAAVPEAKALMLSAVKNMNVDDAKKILGGGDDAVTRFFRDKTSKQLTQAFLPLVKKVTDKAGLAQQYNQLAGQASSLGLVKKQDSKIENYVTRKTLDGLFATLAEQERNIRKDPIGTGSALLKKIYGG